MNNGNEILKAQETEGNIKLLAAQRQMYSDAKKYSGVATFLSLFIPIVITLLQGFISIQYWILVLIAFIILITGNQLGKHIKRLIESAAQIQQRFDSNVFDMSFCNSNITISKIKKYSMRYVKRCGEAKLHCWYTVPLDGMNEFEAISSCQLQNAKWTKGLVTRYFILGLIVALLIAVAITVEVILGQTSWENLFFLLPICEWIFERFQGLINLRKKAGKLEADAEHYILNTKENIEIIQNDIYDYRSSTILIPDWFYKLFKRRDDAITSL